ncbi:MAG TPA: isoprenyl transferase [Rickettsiales bacterium]|nr:isoprenyl transferase [Rickettsiales bacterium]
MPSSLPANIPKHVAIIMDGNGRWAKSRGLPRIMGHKKGAEVVREVLTACRDFGVEYLTIYAFSSENWKRPVLEVTDLMDLLRAYLKREIATLHKNGIRLKIIGDRSRLSQDILEQIDAAEAMTAQNTTFTLVVALSYGSRQEIVHAAREIARRAAEGKLQADAIDEDTISSLLYTQAIPDPDILIRTSGEQRISNFLLWQSAYTEFYFTDVLWPDFTRQHLQDALVEYSNRERRYGTSS